MSEKTYEQGYADGQREAAERIARNIEAEANHDVVRNATLATAARIAREGA